MLVEFQQANGDTIYVNTDHVVGIVPAKDTGAVILTTQVNDKRLGFMVTSSVIETANRLNLTMGTKMAPPNK